MTKKKQRTEALVGYHITLSYHDADHIYVAEIVRQGQVIWEPKPGSDPAFLTTDDQARWLHPEHTC